MNRTVIALLSAVLIQTSTATARAQVAYAFTTIDAPGAAGTDAYDINSAGAIAGMYLAPPTFHGYVRSPAGTLTQIDVPGATATGALGINDPGQVVGYYVAANVDHGFLLSGGTYTTLDVPGAMQTIAAALNASGQVVGYFADNSGQFSHSFLWSAAAGFTTFDFPGAALYTEANGINDAGQVVGYYSNSVGLHGFLRSPAGVYTTIDAPGSDPNFPNTQAEGVNNLGVIAGFFSDATTGLDRGFVLSGGVYTTVDVPGAFYTRVFDINDAGQLIGVYGTTLNEEHGFLATPVPEPSSLVLSCAGLVLALGMSRRVKRGGHWPQRSGEKSLRRHYNPINWGRQTSARENAVNPKT